MIDGIREGIFFIMKVCMQKSSTLSDAILTDGKLKHSNSTRSMRSLWMNHVRTPSKCQLCNTLPHFVSKVNRCNSFCFNLGRQGILSVHYPRGIYSASLTTSLPL